MFQDFFLIRKLGENAGFCCRFESNRQAMAHVAFELRGVAKVLGTVALSKKIMFLCSLQLARGLETADAYQS